MTRPSSKRPESDRNDVWAEVRGTTYYGNYSVADGWVEVIADDGRYKTGQIGDSSPKPSPSVCCANCISEEAGLSTPKADRPRAPGRALRTR